MSNRETFSSNPDEVNLPQLTRRQEEILAVIVRTYTQKPEPVSSKFLMEASLLNVSSATIRNEMSVLEELGYISAPHTSAGRVPTRNGYRYFVQRLMSTMELDTRDQTHISTKMQSLPLATEQWMRHAAALLARTAQAAALVTPPITESSRFKHVELIAVQGRLVLMVLVLQEGAVHQQMLTLAEPVAQERLSDIATRINNLFVDLLGAEVRVKGLNLGLLEREIAELISDMMDRRDTHQVDLVYRDGLTEMISAFQQNNEGAQQAVRVLEERAFLNLIVNQLLSREPNTVQVIIAGDGRWEELSHLTMILSRYGIPGQVSGAIGVLGPTHMNYGRGVSTVRYLSGLMTNMLADVYNQPDKENSEEKKTSADQ
jgi:heat-inducible transcriptional repressor